MNGKAYLVLANGKVFEGRGFGAAADTIGEIVFTTGMTGYLETLTDPSYFGQIVIMTFPLIGNYGIIPGDFESRHSYVRGYIVKEWCNHPSNFRSEGNLHEYLKEQGIPGLYGIDTRALTKMIRDEGVMGGAITTDPSLVDIDALKSYTIGDAVSQVTSGGGDAPEGSGCKVALWDFGAKGNITRVLSSRGCSVRVFGSGSTAQQIMDSKPDGIMLSNGPGDPEMNTSIIKEIAQLTKSGLPIFGICLGHQLLALACGGATEKMKFGHRGANHPVREHATGRVMITSQNHGFVVAPDSLPANAEVSYSNANDCTCEGITYKDFPGLSVQFHPEAAAGPKDTAFLFDRFMEMMEGKGNAS